MTKEEQPEYAINLRKMKYRSIYFKEKYIMGFHTDHSPANFCTAYNLGHPYPNHGAQRRTFKQSSSCLKDLKG